MLSLVVASSHHLKFSGYPYAVNQLNIPGHEEFDPFALLDIDD